MRKKHYPGEFQKTLCGHNCTESEWSRLKYNKERNVNCYRCIEMLKDVRNLKKTDRVKLIEKYYDKSKYWKDRLQKGNSMRGTEHQNGRPGGEKYGTD